MVTVQVAVLLPSTVVAVMVAFPAATPVTTPFATVATAVLLLVHVTALLVALEGETVAVKVDFASLARVRLVLSRLTPVTVTAALTVTEQVAVWPPSFVVTVIVALPALTAVTVPFETLATEVLLLFHVIFLFVALVGATVAVSVSVPPTIRLEDDLFKVTPVTETEVEMTVIAQVAVLLPSTVVTVMVAVPALTPVTVPFDDTLATAGALLNHVTFLLVALEGETVAVSLSLPPVAILIDVLSKVTPVTAMGALTVTAQVAVKPPSSVVTVMTAFPIAMPVTSPADDTVATAGLSLLHETFRFVASDGSIVALRVSVPPTPSDSVFLFKLTPVTSILLGLTMTSQDAE
jgi:hypothetical protein